ncbi:16S rRNA (guanine(527)-N(7))-methyltransferase RsmG [Variovorax sp. HJSM1_2]|uniref:16S rRNA (guanine(527)-N(7))-methyltransferase RsmG n=1 Tax=Variovorax sp. HJSM1_2 TaxID=3366263 RepID=UPI003BEB2DC9
MSERATEYAVKLADAAAQLGINLSATQQDLLLQYIAMIGKWNKVYNLTALRDPAEMFSHHLLDSLAAVPPLQKHLQGRAQTKNTSAQLLDVGSGAGLPGVVFAICCPELTVRCVDTVGKKAAFVQQVAVELKLANLRGIHARVESLTDKYDVVSSRAFASLLDFSTWSRSALADDGVWFAMKGKTPTEEQAALPADVQVFHVEQLQVPGLDAERCIVWLRKTQVG